MAFIKAVVPALQGLSLSLWKLRIKVLWQSISSVHRMNEAFFNRAKGVIDKIIAGQTLDVDVVSGATYSSNGIISAVKNALTGEQDTNTTAAAANSSTQTRQRLKL